MRHAVVGSGGVFFFFFVRCGQRPLNLEILRLFVQCQIKDGGALGCRPDDHLLSDTFDLTATADDNQVIMGFGCRNA